MVLIWKFLFIKHGGQRCPSRCFDSLKSRLEQYLSIYQKSKPTDPKPIHPAEKLWLNWEYHRSRTIIYFIYPYCAYQLWPQFIETIVTWRWREGPPPALYHSSRTTQFMFYISWLCIPDLATVYIIETILTWSWQEGPPSAPYHSKRTIAYT